MHKRGSVTIYWPTHTHTQSSRRACARVPKCISMIASRDALQTESAKRCGAAILSLYIADLEACDL